MATKTKLPKRLQGLETREGWDVLVMVPNYWGRGKTVAEAVENCRKVGGRGFGRGPIRVYQAAENQKDGRVHVDDMGNLCWSWSGPARDNRPELVFEAKR